MPKAITTNELSKAYQVGKRAESPDTIASAAKKLLLSPLTRMQELRRLNTHHSRHDHDTFWALKNVSFEVNQGDVVGIIGRNGAGKSTLLKVLSRITHPTAGTALIRGRVSSLLEVGTGFHEELTGRENAYMNGTILGMSKKEIDRKFDEIVAFSGVEDFLDTPVKRYSSGMRVRLAFAVAAHLEPDILIIDEVLAVGDVQFQRKCLGKMQEVSSSGRTVLFVSHNLALMRGFCDRGILLRHGEVKSEGTFFEAIAAYDALATESAKENSLTDLHEHTNRRPSMRKLIQSLEINGRTDSSAMIRCGSSMQLVICIDTNNSGKDSEELTAAVFICLGGSRVAMLHSKVNSNLTFTMQRKLRISCELKSLPLLPGTYSLDLAVGRKNEVLDYIEDVATLTIESGDPFGTGLAPNSSQGILALASNWKIL